MSRLWSYRPASPLVVGAIACLAASMIAAGCGSSSGGGQSSSTSTAASPSANAPEVTPPASIKAADKIVYCIDWTNPPMEFNTGGPTPKGSDPDTGAAIARMMGVKAQWVYLGFDGLIAALESNKCDAILSGMNNTPQRAQVVDFVNYVSVGDVIMVRQADASHHYTSLLQLAGKRMATETGTTEWEQIVAANKKLAAEGKPQISLTFLPTSADEIAALQTGKTDADFNQAPAEAYAISHAPPNTFAIVSGAINAAPIAIATRKGDSALHDAIAEAVNKLYSSGEMCKILTTWNEQTLTLPGKPACQ